MQRKIAIIQPVDPKSGLVSQQTFFSEKGILRQIWELIFNASRNLFAVYGMIVFIWWILS